MVVWLPLEWTQTPVLGMDRPDLIARRLAAYHPKVLETHEWEHAAAPVRELVRMAAPPRAQDAITLASTLCRFLQSPCGWDRESPPDFLVLLTEGRIETFAAEFAGSAANRATYTARLRRLRRTIHGIESPVQRAYPKAVTRELAEVAAATQSLSLPTTAAVFRARTGKQLTDGRLYVLAKQLVSPRPSPTAPAGVPGIVTPDPGARGLTLDAPDIDLVMEVVPTTQSRPKAKGARPLSRRQELALDRAERAAIARMANGPVLSAEPSMDGLAPDVQKAIVRYRPQSLDREVWLALRPLTLRMVIGFRPSSVVNARNVATITVRFLEWVWTTPRRSGAGVPTALELVSGTLLDAYLALPLGHRSHYAVFASRSTAASVLRRSVRSLDAHHRSVPSEHKPIAPPYTPQECEEFAALAMLQPTKAKVRNACYFFGLTLGAGLSASDLRYIRKMDIRTVNDAVHGSHLTVTVAAGDAPRTVPIRRAYEPLVRCALDMDSEEPPERLALGRKMDRRHVTIVARNGVTTARQDESVPISSHRLRTTWLFACMNSDIPLASLLQIAGLRSARSLADLLPLCPAPDPAAVQRALLEIEDARPKNPSPKG